ncbi:MULTISPECIES: phosphatidate cytidylyltransferase [unclassified Minwuia]|uniref:phosphatidate cytidylyltransferase n=1 Tax=unclassified Minwuia TaxID=2618799 RepID=UPI002479C350|nr:MULTISPECIES: phosphatidate cytidylyltransferase [unclassified Minwuia]
MADSDLRLGARIGSALVLGTIVILAALAGGVWFNVVLVIAGSVAAFEWSRVTATADARATAGRFPLAMAIGLLGGVAAIALLDLGTTIGIALSAVVVSTVLAGLAAWFAGGRAIWTMLGVAVICGAMLALLMLRQWGAWPLIWLLACVWASDIGALAAGRTFQGPRIWVRVSPNKRWSGAAGGVVAAAVTSVAIGLGSGMGGDTEDLSVTALLSGGVLVSVVAQCGDLAESAWKRHFGVKDSGTIIPGHGGIIDRVDGLVAAAIMLALMPDVMGFAA